MKVMRAGAMIGLSTVTAIAALLGMLSLDHNKVTTLPDPTGPFAVGRTMAFWRDATQAEPMAPEPGARREILAWIWYPAERGRPSQTPAPYLPPPWRDALRRRTGPVLNLLTRDLSGVRSHSVRDAEMSPRFPSYPVVVMRAGLAALTADYTTLAEDLASHGYVVLGFDAPYRSWIVVLPDGTVVARAPRNNADLVSGPQKEQLATRLVQAWCSDTAFALDELGRLNSSDPSSRFMGRLDLQRVGVFGHSLGGATALQFCRDDARCKAGIDVDGAPLGSVVHDGVRQPFLFLLSDHGRESGPEKQEVEANIRSIYDRLPADRRLLLVIRGAGHFGFSDVGALLRSPLLMRGLRFAGVVRLDGRRQLAITTHYVCSFFDVYLKGAPASELPGRDEYPEVVPMGADRRSR
jgi:pimeloyl-ACP methyl ester carboxylesterase